MGRNTMYLYATNMGVLMMWAALQLKYPFRYVVPSKKNFKNAKTGLSNNIKRTVTVLG